MTRTELPEYSAYIITEYYKNNIQPFLDSFSKNCLWIGPAEGQIIRTKKTLLDTFSKENNQLTFAMQNLQVIPIPINATSMDVILTYTVISYYPDGATTVFQQRNELLWAEETLRDADGNSSKTYTLRVCHISNEFPYDTRDTIYPNHFTELDIAKLYTGKVNMCKSALKGLHNSYFYLSADTIMWLESKGIHTLIHTVDKVYEAAEKISNVVKQYSDTLCQVHASYAINPQYVASIGRFFVELDNGKRINIPEKKYTKTRDEINRRIMALKEA